ncbi:divalent-cation tolerance protein CutA [Dactylosporangium roseum]|uniref:Divalent-cation tolerance protein CutA n=1 Tax=Dactylosporangium roseum TaxID=47989 RepID=A0ABY5ZCZ4_9ACTN|nr:divalent-cation tolerance protein CutA [Dactylosporangium roseum]UWZ38850.1 divalent-cation tolerance protein CutA [Dactylosporangium roseum]
MTDYLQVSTVLATRQDAAYLARSATHSRLAAAAQVIGPVLSMTWHEGTLVETEEWQLVLRTRVERFDQLTAYIVDRHPEPDPEVVGVPIVPGTRSYLDWLDRKTSVVPG